MADRPTWALIDDACQAATVAEGFANTIASRRRGAGAGLAADERIARQAADAFKRGARMLAMLEREDPDGD